MSTVTSKRLEQRPYTVGTFQKRLNDFEEFIKEITLQDVEATPEERRQMITGMALYWHFIFITLTGADAAFRGWDLCYNCLLKCSLTYTEPIPKPFFSNN